jgi:hypothetical protein
MRRDPSRGRRVYPRLVQRREFLAPARPRVYPRESSTRSTTRSIADERLELQPEQGPREDRRDSAHHPRARLRPRRPCEIGGMETLEAFNRLYLDGGYDCFLHEENSNRGIFVGALVRRGDSRTRAREARGPTSRATSSGSRPRAEAGRDRLRCAPQEPARRRPGIDRRIDEIKRLAASSRAGAASSWGTLTASRSGECTNSSSAPARPAASGRPRLRGRAPRTTTHALLLRAPAQLRPLDYIFCTHDIEVLEAGVVEEAIRRIGPRGIDPSDHLFIWARVAL